jgi:hypothetical protein
VLTSSSFLQAQLDSELKPYLKGADYTICYFTIPAKQHNYLIGIVDEADE